MARRWVEKDHPRHPGDSPGGKGGQFREKVGGAGWAARLNAMLGGRRGASERQVRRAGGRSDLDDVDYRDPDSPEMRDAEQQIAAGLAGPARGAADYEPRAGTFIGNVPSTHGNARPQSGGILAALRARVESEPRLRSRITDEDLAQLNDAIVEEVIRQSEDEIAINPLEGGMTFDEYVVDSMAEQLRRFGPDELWPDLVSVGGMADGGNLPRLTNQEVADALAPQREAPGQIGSFESLPDTDEPGVKEATAQNLADYPGLRNGDYEVYDSLNGWGVVLDAYETDRYSYEDDDETIIEIEGEGIHFTAEAGEGIQIRRAGAGSREQSSFDPKQVATEFAKRINAGEAIWDVFRTSGLSERDKERVRDYLFGTKK